MDTTPKMNSPKVNINSLSPQEARLYRLYGRVPSPSHHFAKHLKERKYFDSGDYALSKAGRTDVVVGSLLPAPQDIPHPHLYPNSSPTFSPATSPTSTDMPYFSRSRSFSGHEGADHMSSPLRSDSAGVSPWLQRGSADQLKEH